MIVNCLVDPMANELLHNGIKRFADDIEKLEGIVRTFGNLPAWNERLEARGAHGMHALRVCTGTKAAAPAVEPAAPIFGNGLLHAFKTARRIPVRETST